MITYLGLKSDTVTVPAVTGCQHMALSHKESLYLIKPALIVLLWAIFMAGLQKAMGGEKLFFQKEKESV